MRVQRLPSPQPSGFPVVVLDEADQPIAIISEFLRHLSARDYSPNTLVAYAYDLLHFWAFLQQRTLSYQEFTLPAHWSFWTICVRCPAANECNASA